VTLFELLHGQDVDLSLASLVLKVFRFSKVLQILWLEDELLLEISRALRTSHLVRGLINVIPSWTLCSC
jgi:hypothetical protein